MLRLNGVAFSGPAPFDLTDRGLTLGDGLFETIAVFSGRPALLGEHLDRLTAAAREIRLPVDREALGGEVRALAGTVPGDAVIRLTVTRGAGARGLAIPKDARPSVIVALSPFPNATLNAPVQLATASTRRNPTSFAARAKTLSYLDSALAFDEARRAGADDALMLNTDGRVASTAMANLFAAFGEKLVTPPVSEGVLPGIIRAVVLAASGDLGLETVERPIEPAEFMAADAIFATNSVRLVMPVTAIDGRPVAQSPTTRWISELVSLHCGAGARS